MRMPRPRRLRSTRWIWALPVLVLAAGLALLVTLLSGAAPARTLVHATHLPSPGTTTLPQPGIGAPSLRSVAVTPSRDLVDFEPVTISGIKFPGNSLIETAQCVPGQVGYSTC